MHTNRQDVFILQSRETLQVVQNMFSATVHGENGIHKTAAGEQSACEKRQSTSSQRKRLWNPAYMKIWELHIKEIKKAYKKGLTFNPS